MLKTLKCGIWWVLFLLSITYMYGFVIVLGCTITQGNRIILAYVAMQLTLFSVMKKKSPVRAPVRGTTSNTVEAEPVRPRHFTVEEGELRSKPRETVTVSAPPEEDSKVEIKEVPNVEVKEDSKVETKDVPVVEVKEECKVEPLVKPCHKTVEGTAAITFADIAGYETTKENMKFIVDCLKDPEALTYIGATVPNGVLFYGPPGTGKTRMASAIAGTAGVHFLEVNASSFANTYVGTGAAAVRALYQEARENAPCVVFIDEIDSVGGKRTGELNQEYRTTINALLSQLDGMNKGEGIMTIAATNDLAMLDEALIRPGRFDRKVHIPLPNVQDRYGILRLHSKKKRLAQDVDLQKLAQETEGFSGATLANVLNESALLCVAEKGEAISKAHIEKVTFQLLTAGEETSGQQGKLGQMVAWHEAGHALCLKVLCGQRVPRVTIKGSTSGALGLTIHTEEGVVTTKKQMRQYIKAVYGGRAAEFLFYGAEDEVTSSASGDVDEASRMIGEYGRLFGFSDTPSLVNFDVAMGRSGFGSVSPEEMSYFAQTLYEETVAFLQDNLGLLEKIATTLLERESLDDRELSALLATFEESEVRVMGCKGDRLRK